MSRSRISWIKRLRSGFINTLSVFLFISSRVWPWEKLWWWDRWWEWIWRCAKVQLWVCMCVILFNTTTYSSNWILRLETETQQVSISASSSLSVCWVTNGTDWPAVSAAAPPKTPRLSVPRGGDLPLEISLDNPISTSSPQHTCRNAHTAYIDCFH